MVNAGVVDLMESPNQNACVEQKEEVHREATRLTAMQHRDDGVTLPYGARKVALNMGPGEKNSVQGFRKSTHSQRANESYTVC